jgi:hypothetical protein
MSEDTLGPIGSRTPAVALKGLHVSAADIQKANFCYSAYQKALVAHLPGMLMQIVAAGIFFFGSFRAPSHSVMQMIALGGAMISVLVALIAATSANHRVKTALQVYRECVLLIRSGKPQPITAGQ